MRVLHAPPDFLRHGTGSCAWRPESSRACASLLGNNGGDSSFRWRLGAGLLLDFAFALSSIFVCVGCGEICVGGVCICVSVCLLVCEVACACVPVTPMRLLDPRPIQCPSKEIDYVHRVPAHPSKKILKCLKQFFGNLRP